MQSIQSQSKWERRAEHLKRIGLRKWPLWFTLAVFMAAGTTLIYIREAGFFHEIGVALIIASLLGGSVDIYLRQGIAKDAFEGAMGYFLPSEIKEAVKYLGSIDWFAEEFSLTVKLEKMPNDLVSAISK